MWEAADKLPVLVFAGDFWQLPSVQGTLARAPMPGRRGRWRARCGAVGRAIKRGWASQYSLGEPVLGEPSNEVGASHQTRLGRAIKRGWASQY